MIIGPCHRLRLPNPSFLRFSNGPNLAQCYNSRHQTPYQQEKSSVFAWLLDKKKKRTSSAKVAIWLKFSHEI